MDIHELQKLYARHPKLKALGKMLMSDRRDIPVAGLQASAAPLLFASLPLACPEAVMHPFLFILNDEEEAGYFYHDLTQLLGNNDVLIFPSGKKRTISSERRDSAGEILRTEVLSRLAAGRSAALYVVTHPDALDETVPPPTELKRDTLVVSVGMKVDEKFVKETLQEYGFHRVDYVYEPGQYAIRGSLIDVYSYTSEYPYRIDFFGDEVDSIRTFDIQQQTSVEKKQEITIVPEFAGGEESTATLLDYFSDDVTLVYKESVGREYGGFRHVVMSASAGKDGALCFDISPQPVFHKNFDLLVSTLQRLDGEDYELYILADSEKQTDRLESIFHDKETGIHFTPVNRTLHAGFCDNERKLCLFTDHQIFDRFHKYTLRSEQVRKGKVAMTLKEIQQLHPGDYVVHVDHGVGIFGGLVRMNNGGAMQEVIRINYRDQGTVFVSIHALYKISKYKGKEGEAPKLSALGSGAWLRLKERTKNKIKDIARDLIKLYSRRRQEKGFAYSPDSYLQHQLEASFLYEDTPDQFKATADVKADMERARPMDRLVCGDVGFGKTEVAIRAAFKAAADSKQVAVLVPTTVLAYQHYRTFKKRLEGMPVRVDYLSRARSAKQTTEILEDLKQGKIDILIGTHRLISKSVKFKDLGLLIIDEEQKFGVSTKEKLRQMKTNVDTLTLTATPIPRTLQFSLMGARDLSIIQTPPPNRYPIQTELCVFSPDIIREAISLEMERSGQVFFVCNRISSLPHLEEIIHSVVPEARVAVGHGQMSPERLEEVVLGFVNYDYDVLLSTTIIESGVDIPNANTIIISDAHHFGLSDLHQMRGRVGRSNRKAFCYLLAPPFNELGSEAKRRLEAIENFSDLGSGINIAMQDLDIRGAGNLLGAEQSGFIADLGYETYQKILSEAVKELRHEEFRDLLEEDMRTGMIKGGEDFVDDCQLDSDLPLYFPESYVPTSTERMQLYRELDSLESDVDTESFRQRMMDRFGAIPEEGENLIRVVRLRMLGKSLGVEKITLRQRRMRLQFVSQDDSPFYSSSLFGRIIEFCAVNVMRCQLKEVGGTRSLTIQEVVSVEAAIKLLEALKGDSAE
ncbi:MAG: transcription-repair coupling factor [Bacteroidaceae bacterium]|nr:transcription-repair coupling factor [Bacteroidaceae bacterium]